MGIAPALGAAFGFLRGGSGAGRPAPRPIARPAPPRAAMPAAVILPRPPRPSVSSFAPPEPRAPSESDSAPSSREDRVALIGVLILAAIAGLVLLVVSYLDSLN